MAFPAQAGGSLIVKDGKPVGSSLIGQNFSDPKYFWGRPSATGPMPYNAGSSSGSNQGPLNPALVDAVKGRVEALRAADPGNTAPVPVDLVTASAQRPGPAHQPRPQPSTRRRASRSVRGLSADAVQGADRRSTPQGACSGCPRRGACQRAGAESRAGPLGRPQLT